MQPTPSTSSSAPTAVETDAIDDIVIEALSKYRSLAAFPQPGKFTIFASFILSSRTAQSRKVISLGTGCKCLPATRLPPKGDALHDCHAEVLARRGAVRWFLEEAQRDGNNSMNVSLWISRGNDGLYELSEDVDLYLYVSTLPCGDSSTRLLASLQDPAMAALKDSSTWPDLPPGTPSRGRDNYARLGVLRTKPGRADAPTVLSMSCSDKIARWSVLGIQGSLASSIFRPIYLSGIIIGEVDEEKRETVRMDCERAFYDRIKQLDSAILPCGFRLAKPFICFTSLPFMHSQTTLGNTTRASNDSICWIADSDKPHEVLINGLRRGVPPKHISNAKFRPLLSKISLYALYLSTLEALSLPLPPKSSTYCAVKQSVVLYQHAKRALLGPSAPFAGWICSGRQWEGFDCQGALSAVPVSVAEDLTVVAENEAQVVS